MSESLTQFILPIKLEKSSERLTSLGGLVVLEEMARALKVWEKVDGALEGPKSGRGYEPDEFVQPLVGMLHAGGRRLEELRELRGEREVLERLGLEAVPDAGTVGDWLRRQGMTGAAEIAQVSQELIAECLNQEPEALTLDVDATEIEAEKQEAQWTYQQVKGYRPLVGYGKGWCVGHEFGEGSPSPGAGIGEFARQCEAALPEGKRIYFRSESAAYPAAVINQYSQAGRSFTITADLDQAVRREIAHRPETAWKPYRTAEGLATDREEPASAAIRRHNQRGQCENWHKELKAGLGMEQMPCGEFEANALYFAIGVLAYNLAERLKRRGLPESYRTVTVATLRWKLDRLAAKLVRHARGWVLQVKADLEKWRLLESARAGCAGLGN